MGVFYGCEDHLCVFCAVLWGWGGGGGARRVHLPGGHREMAGETAHNTLPASRFMLCTVRFPGVP